MRKRSAAWRAEAQTAKRQTEKVQAAASGNERWHMKRKGKMLLLAVCLLLFMNGCGWKEKQQQKHEQLLEELGEKNRQYHAKRRRFLESDLCAAGMQYVQDTLEELEPGRYIDATEEELAASLETEEARKIFFAQVQLYISIDFWEFAIDPQVLCEELLKRQIACADIDILGPAGTSGSIGSGRVHDVPDQVRAGIPEGGRTGRRVPEGFGSGHICLPVVDDFRYIRTV